MLTPKPEIALVGAGRAGTALAVALSDAGYPVTTVCSRDSDHADQLAARVGAWSVTTPLLAMQAADITLLTVPDPAIAEAVASVVARGAELAGRAVVHCSASRGLEVLAPLRLTGASVGSLHPLQALAGEASAALLRGSLMAVDGDPGLLDQLRRMVRDLGGRPVAVAPRFRGLYHAAASLAGNAPLALVAAATELMATSGIDAREAEAGLISLMQGALANARRGGAKAALTGPVVRADAETVSLHLAALHGRPGADALYRALARATLRLAGEEGRESIAALLDDGSQNQRSANGHRQGDAGVRVKRGFAQARVQPRRAKAAARQSGRADARAERNTTPASPHGAGDSNCQ